MAKWNTYIYNACCLQINIILFVSELFYVTDDDQIVASILAVFQQKKKKKSH